jgi:hypothetical protein
MGGTHEREDQAMIEHSTLIRASADRVTVLRVLCDGRSCWPLRYEVEARVGGWCRRCGCTDRFGCASPHCVWVNERRTLCSRCAERIAR